MSGSCGFDRGLCNYEHNSGNQNFKWIKMESSGEDKSFLRVNTTGAYTNDSAQIWSPLMPVKKVILKLNLVKNNQVKLNYFFL